MSDVDRASAPVVESLRGHVLAPLDEAVRTVERETGEVEAELRAYESFKKRVAGIETVSAGPTTPTTRTYAVESRSRAVERVRNAFRETVMSVDHYDDVYDESLDEHAAAELSAEVAAGLRRDAGTPFTDVYKRTLTAAAATAVEQRTTLLEVLAGERESVADTRERLDGIVDDCEGAGWGQLDVADRLDEVARARQETLRTRTPTARTDGHDLCTYLYADYDWTYPVLTAVTRFRNATG